MKKTQFIELLSNIKATFMSFFAISLFVVLSIGVFAGISWTSPALQSAADRIYDEGSLYDIEIQFPNGLTDKDLDKIRTVEGVDRIETGYVTTQMMRYGGKTHVTKITSLGKTMNQLVHVEGTLPVRRNEIAVNSRWAEEKGLKIGDKVSFKHDKKSDKKDGMKFLKEDRYKVTAIVDSPAYVSYNLSSYGMANIGSGYIQCLAFVSEKSFDTKAYPGYVEAYIRSDSLRGMRTGTKKYSERANEIAEEVTALGDSLSEKRYKDLKTEFRNKIKKYEKKLAKAKTRIKNAEKRLADGKAKLRAYHAKYNSSKKKLDKGYRKLVNGQKTYDRALKDYNESKAFVAEMKMYRDKYASDTLTYSDIEEMNRTIDDYKEGRSEDSEYNVKYDENVELFFKTVTPEDWDGDENADRRAVGREENLKRIDENLAEADEKLAEAKVKLDDGKKKLDKGWAKYNKYKKKLNAGKAKLDAYDAKAAAYEAKIAAAKAKYKAGAAKLAKAKDNLKFIKNYDWTIITRENNGGQMVIQRFCDLTDNLRYSMATLFIIIGLLVSYSSISRIVKDQIVSIGTKKALGLRRREITLSYLAYSGVAVAIGSLLGLLLGTFGIEQILAKSIGPRFITGIYSSYFSPLQALGLVAIEMVMVLTTTYLACKNILDRQAVELLKGEKPPKGRERFFEKWMIWKKLPLFSKTVVNNCLNDRRRVIGTIIGIAGCTSLVVTALTVNNNIGKSMDYQYRDVYSYDTIVRYQTSSADPADIRSRLDGAGVESTKAYQSPYRIIKPDGSQTAVTITVPFEDNYSDFVHLNGESSEAEYKDGIWISKAYASHFDTELGDKVRVMDSEGQIKKFTVQGIFDHYMFNNQIVMSRKVFRKVFEQPAEANVFIVDSGKLTADDIKDALKGAEGIRMVKDDYNASKDLFDEFANIAGAIVIVYLVLSVLMAIIVLYDLYSVFIDEKKKELIILMINGFSIKDARAYIYRDTVFLSVLGIICGVIFGCIMGNITVFTLEPDMGFFIKTIDLKACLIGACVSGALAAILCSIAMRKISRFKLADINKL